MIENFYWLQTPVPRKKLEIEASCLTNRVTITASTNLTAATVFVDGRLVDFEQPVVLECNGKVSTHTLRPSLRVLCETLLRRGDPDLASTAKLELPLSKASGLTTDERNWLRRLFKAGVRSAPRP